MSQQCSWGFHGDSGRGKNSLCIKTREQISPVKLPPACSGCCYEVMAAGPGPAGWKRALAGVRAAQGLGDGGDVEFSQLSGARTRRPPEVAAELLFFLEL